jgi:hypothetical protein
MAGDDGQSTERAALEITFRDALNLSLDAAGKLLLLSRAVT